MKVPTRLLTIAALFVLALLPTRLFAAQSATLVWTMPSTTVADAQSFNYAIQDGVLPGAPLTGVVCSTVAAQTQCQSPIAAPAQGPHSLVITASSLLGFASSAPLAGQTPGAPNGLKIVITITVP